jgi:hypothetical protein
MYVAARRRRERDTNHHDYKDKYISFIWRRVEALTNCLTRMLKSSKPGNERATERVAVLHLQQKRTWFQKH